MSVATIYSHFTENPYSASKLRLSEKTRTNNIIDFLHWFSNKASARVVVIGDYNLNVFDNTISKRRLYDWCAEVGADQLVHEPTRIFKNTNGTERATCIDLCIVRLNDQ